MKRPAVFFDRDNTLIACDGFLGDPEKVVLVDGAAEAVARVKELGFAAVVFSNQSGVARGMFTEEAVHAVNHRLDDLLQEDSPTAVIDRHDFCPFHPTAKVERYRVDSDLRKPKPGMIYRAERVLNLDLSRSWVVGDAPRDIAAGHAAGLRTVLLKIESLPPSPATSEGAGVEPDFVARSLAEAIEYIEQESRPDGHDAGAANPSASEAPIDAIDESGSEPDSVSTAPEASGGWSGHQPLAAEIVEHEPSRKPVPPEVVDSVAVGTDLVRFDAQSARPSAEDREQDVATPDDVGSPADEHAASRESEASDHAAEDSVETATGADSEAEIAGTTYVGGPPADEPADAEPSPRDLARAAAASLQGEPADAGPSFGGEASAAASAVTPSSSPVTSPAASEARPSTQPTSEVVARSSGSQEEPVKLTPRPNAPAGPHATDSKKPARPSDSAKPVQGGFVVKPHQAPAAMTWGERMRMARQGGFAPGDAGGSGSPSLPDEAVAGAPSDGDDPSELVSPADLADDTSGPPSESGTLHDGAVSNATDDASANDQAVHGSASTSEEAPEAVTGSTGPYAADDLDRSEAGDAAPPNNAAPSAPASEPLRGARREDSEGSPATPERPAVSGDLSHVENLLEQLLDELRRREDMAAADFSVSKLMAGITQVLALAALFFAYFSQNKVQDMQSTLMVGVLLQTLTISLLLMGRQR